MSTSTPYYPRHTNCTNDYLFIIFLQPKQETFCILCACLRIFALALLNLPHVVHSSQPHLTNSSDSNSSMFFVFKFIHKAYWGDWEMSFFSICFLLSSNNKTCGTWKILGLQVLWYMPHQHISYIVHRTRRKNNY